MKLTRSHLRNLIKEELSQALNEATPAIAAVGLSKLKDLFQDEENDIDPIEEMTGLIASAIRRMAQEEDIDALGEVYEALPDWAKTSDAIQRSGSEALQSALAKLGMGMLGDK